jgi:hypothetical protein
MAIFGDNSPKQPQKAHYTYVRVETKKTPNYVREEN